MLWQNILLLRISKCCMLILSLLVSLPSSIYTKTITVYNKSPIDIYAATYYHKLFSAQPIERYSSVVSIPAQQNKELELPPMVWDIRTSRELVFDVNEHDLTDKIAEDRLKLLSKRDIGKTPSNSFYISLEKGKLEAYDAIDWKATRPLLGALKIVKKELLSNPLNKKLRQKFVVTPYSYQEARIRLGTNIPIEEQKVIDKRFTHVKHAVEQLVDQKLENFEVPRIAICGSGGGYRAMIATLGSLLGAESIGLLNATLYISALSGSTWMLAPWLTQNISLQQFKQQLQQRVNQAFMKNFFLHPLVFTNYLIKKYVYGQGVSLIDFYGTILASNLLNGYNTQGGNFHDTYLHDQIEHIQTGEKPYPIYTAIVTKKPYEWVEFTPYEVGSDYLGGYIPSWSLGRRFFKGISEAFQVNNSKKLFAPPLPLGYFLGMWGSALSVNFRELWQEVSQKYKTGILSSALSSSLETTILGGQRILPAQVYNFTYGYTDLPRGQQSWLTLVDAGINFNLPMPPLLREARNIDVIIVLDASGEANVGSELQKTADYFAKRSIRFPIIDYNDIDTKVCNVFYNKQNNKTPAIIYLPLIANKAYKPTFTRDCLHNYCSTFNFEYTPEQFNILSGLTEFNMKQSKDCIVKLLRQVIATKRKHFQKKNG